MAQRLIRSEILTSEPVNSLSWPAEIFYRRLMSVVDDYGRYTSDHRILRASLYPLQLHKVGESDIGKWLSETTKAGLVSLYTVESKGYLELHKFGQRLQQKVSKYPVPSNKSPESTVTNGDSPPEEKGSRREVEIEGEGETDRSRARPGSQQAVSDYFGQLKILNPAKEAEKFMNHHQSKGWIIGRTPMKDWKAAARTWAGNCKKADGDLTEAEQYAEEKGKAVW